MAEDNKVLYPELSYTLVGIAFEIFNEYGYGISEKYFQQLFAAKLLEKGIAFIKEYYVSKIYNGKVITRWYLDFLIEGKVIVELKVRHRLGYVHIQQVMDYLNVTGHKLALLIYATKEGVKYRRILNARVAA